MTLAALESYKRLRDHPVWGFIIYRCDYRDDLAWDHFMKRWSQRVSEWLLRQNERQLIENLAFTVRDDRASLDGATVEDVRKLFTAWTESEEAIAERQAAIDRNVLSSPRYTYCVHVDTEALEECLKYDALPKETQSIYMNPTRDPALGQAAYVNIVEKVVPVYGNSQQNDVNDNEQEDSEEEYSEEEEDAISFKAHWPVVLPDIYNGLNQRHEAFQQWARDTDRDGVSLA